MWRRDQFPNSNYRRWRIGTAGLRNWEGIANWRGPHQDKAIKPAPQERTQNDVWRVAYPLYCFGDIERALNRLVAFYFGSKSDTIARSSFNSFTVALIFPRLNSLTGTPGTISSFLPLLLTGNELISPFSTP